MTHFFLNMFVMRSSLGINIMMPARWCNTEAGKANLKPSKLEVSPMGKLPALPKPVNQDGSLLLTHLLLKTYTQVWLSLPKPIRHTGVCSGPAAPLQMIYSLQEIAI